MAFSIMNRMQGYQPVPTDDIESYALTKQLTLNQPIKQGDYRHNKNILDSIFSETGKKKSHIAEVMRQKGIDAAIEIVTTSLAMTASYYVTTALLEETPNLLQMYVNQENPSEMHKKINAFLAEPEFQRELASFIIKAQVAAGIGSSLVIANAVTNGFAKLGDTVATLFKALCHPQEGQEHEGKTKLLAFRRIADKAAPAIRNLPPEIQIKAEEALEELKGLINHMANPSSIRAPDNNDIKKAADRLFLYFALPLHVEDTYQMGLNGNETLADQFNTEQKDLVGSYDEPLASQLNYIMTLHRYSTINPSVLPINVWMEGPTAVGKTHFVEKMAEACHATLRKMTVYEYLDMRGQPVSNKKSRPRWNAPDFEFMGEAWKDIVVKAKTLNAVNLMDEVKFFNTGDDDNNLDAVEPMKKARNPGNLPSIPIIDVKLKTVEINFYNSNYPMELPLPDKNDENYEAAKIAHEAFIKSFIHIKFPNWSREKFADRVEEKIEACLDAMQGIHAQVVQDSVRKIFYNDLLPVILEQADIHNPSQDQTRITLKEAIAVVNKLGVSSALELDTVYNQQKNQRSNSRSASSSSEILTFSDDKKIGFLIQTIIDDFNIAARDTAVNESTFLKEKQARASESSQKTLSAKQVIPEQTTEEIIAEIRTKIAAIEQMAKTAPTMETIEEKIQDLQIKQQKEMEALIKQAVNKTLNTAEETASSALKNKSQGS